MIYPSASCFDTIQNVSSLFGSEHVGKPEHLIAPVARPGVNTQLPDVIKNLLLKGFR